MTVFVDLKGAPERCVVFTPSPLAELVAVLHAIGHPEHHVRLRPWVLQVARRLPPALAESCRNYSPLWGVYRTRYLLPMSLEHPRSLEAELREIENLDLDTFIRFTAYAIRGGYSGEPLSDVVGNPDRQASVFRRGKARSSEAGALAVELFDDPQKVRAGLVQLIGDFDECIFDEHWKAVADELSSDVAWRRQLEQQQGTASALASVSSSSWVDERHGQVSFDQFHHGMITLRTQSLIAIPSAVSWPHLLIKHEAGWPAVIQYPVPASRESEQQVATEAIRQRLVVLSDPTRLRLCRELVNASLTTTEIAERWNMPAPQISRHLHALRSSGLVQARRSGNKVFYSLELNAIAKLGADLLVSLLR